MTDEIQMTSDKDLLEWRENISGWVGKNGKFYGGEKEGPEDYMKYDVATHKTCPKCLKEKILKYFTWCNNCREARDKERWDSMPEIDYSEVKGVLYSDSQDRYFQDREDAEDYCECEGISLGDLRLMATERVKLREINIAVIEEQIMVEDDPEDYIPDAVSQALKNLNQAIRDSVLDLWEPINKRVRF